MLLFLFTLTAQNMAKGQKVQKPACSLKIFWKPSYRNYQYLFHGSYLKSACCRYPDPLLTDLQSRINNICAAKAIFYCPSMNSHRPRFQNTAKERALIPEKDSTRKRPRSHVILEKSSKNYKPLEK
jgi:hypothetical protein